MYVRRSAFMCVFEYAYACINVNILMSMHTCMCMHTGARYRQQPRRQRIAAHSRIRKQRGARMPTCARATTMGIHRRRSSGSCSRTCAKSLAAMRSVCPGPWTLVGKTCFETQRILFEAVLIGRLRRRPET